MVVVFDRTWWQAYVIIGLLIFWASTAFAQTTTPPGAVLLHEYNNNTDDTSGHTNNGTAMGGPVFVNGSIDRALSLDGVDDYVQVPFAASLQPEFVSVEACFKPNQPLSQGPKFIPIVLKLDDWRDFGSYIDGYAITYETRGEENPPQLRGSFLTFQIGDRNDPGLPGRLAIHADYAVEIGSEAFHHAVGTYDGNVIHLYLDGNIVAFTNHSHPISYLGGPLNIGGNVGQSTLIPGGAKQYFGGIIDEVAIYNRALTAQEVASRAERCLTPVVIPVVIDIKPGSDPNSINLSAAGVIPVAILSSATFDATPVNPASVTLAGARVKLIGKGGKYACHTKDVNGDTLLDLVCQVVTAQFMVEPGDSIAVLEANTFSGTAIRGEDSIRIVPD